MKIGLDTNAFPVSKRISTWRGILCDTYFGVDCDVANDAFHAVVSGYRVGDHSVARDTSSGHYAERSRTLINRDNVERVSFGLILAGRAVLKQSGREAVIEPGMIAFNDSARPFQTWSGAGSDIVWLSVPRQSVADRIRGLDDMTAVAFAPTRPLAQVACDLLTGLDELQTPGISAHDADELVVRTLDVLALAAMSSAVRAAGRFL